MSFKLFPLIWRYTPGFFTSTEKFVLLKLADFAQEDGSSVYPSLKRVSAETGFSEKCIKNTISSLLQKGVLELV